ncbi:MAG TPA: ABC transporter permease [Terracidiphilus sp.]|jgi:predicted permease|nr:ABC transporter permease [Terracidiphilus sp.]
MRWWQITKRDTDLDRELHSDLELEEEEQRERGVPQEEARYAARRAFGNETLIKEQTHEAWGWARFERLWQDVRYAFRQLRKSRGFAATAILTLALGVGSVTAVFSVVYAVLLRPYPFRDPSQIIVWRESIREIENVAPLLPDNYRHYLNLKAHAHSVQDAAIFQNPAFSLSTGVDHPHIAEGLAISPNFFSILGVRPLLGRAFLPEEAQEGRDREVILTWSGWQRLFHGDPSVLDKTLRINGEQVTIVGVLPKSFRFPVMSIMPGEATAGSTDRYEIFTPLVPSSLELTADDAEFNFLVVARLKPGISIRAAKSELDGIEKATAAADHLTIHLSVIVEPFSQEITGDVRKPLWLLLAAIVGVLLMACVNLANLQIVRGVARDHDTALRSALGAGPARLVQGVLIENLLIGLAGGLGGVAFAFLGERIFVRIAAVLPRLNEVHLSTPMLAFALTLSLITSLGFGILPALRALRAVPLKALQGSSARLSGNKQAARSRRFLVTAEVACSVTLLIVTGLMIRSFSHLLTQDRQFSAQHVVLAKADLNGVRYGGGQYPTTNPGADQGSLQRDAMIDQTLDRLRSLPGVEQEAAVTSVMPLTGDMNVDGLRRPDHPVPEGQVPMANRRFVSPGYFSAMGIPLLAGRNFSLADRQKLRVVILSEKAAKAVFPNENPIGHLIQHWGRNYTVIGVTADARINDLKRDAPVFYLPYWDFPPFTPVFIVRSPQTSQTLGPEMRKVIWSVDPDVSIPTITSLDDQVDESVATERFQSVILSSFGVAALLLAVLGIYGVLAYSVSLRTQEFGIRIALGSDRLGLARLVLIDASYPLLGGILLGLLGANLASRWVSSLLYQTSAVDPWAIGSSLAVLLLAALLASLLPVRRAASVDPVQALRSE